MRFAPVIQRPYFLVGITGGFGAGKSTVSALLKAQLFRAREFLMNMLDNSKGAM